MGWYSPEEPIDQFDQFEDFDEIEKVEEVAPVADITPVSRPTLTAIRREEPSEDLTRIVTIHPPPTPTPSPSASFRDGTLSLSTHRYG